MLSDRQISLLQTIINEYISSAQPVGSTMIVEKYNIKYSPATVRNEMAKLLDEGYLEMLHTSSGRIPTKSAYKLFLDQLMEEDALEVLQEVAMKQRLWASRYEFDKMLRQAALALSELTRELSIATTDDGYVIHAGAVNLLDNQEFWNIDTAKAALHLLDRYELLEKIFSQLPENTVGDINYLIDDEIGIQNLEDCAFVVSPYRVGKRHGYIGAFGPSRMNYPKVVPAIRYAKSLIEELGGSW